MLVVRHDLVFVMAEITVGFSGAQNLIFGRGTILKVAVSEYLHEL